ncbi:hypothetical protein D3C80_1823330 [compost metagenome]
MRLKLFCSAGCIQEIGVSAVYNNIPFIKQRNELLDCIIRRSSSLYHNQYFSRLLKRCDKFAQLLKALKIATLRFNQ